MPFDVWFEKSAAAPRVGEPPTEVSSHVARQRYMQKAWITNPIFYPSWMDEGFLFNAVPAPTLDIAGDDLSSMMLRMFTSVRIWHDADNTGFLPPPELGQFGEADLQTSLWRMPLPYSTQDVDISGFAPLPALVPASGRDEQEEVIRFLTAIYPWQEMDTTGFVPAVVLLPTTGDDDYQQLQFPMLPGSLMSLVAMDDSGFFSVPAPVTPQNYLATGAYNYIEQTIGTGIRF